MNDETFRVFLVLSAPLLYRSICPFFFRDMRDLRRNACLFYRGAEFTRRTCAPFAISLEGTGRWTPWSMRECSLSSKGNLQGNWKVIARGSPMGTLAKPCHSWQYQISRPGREGKRSGLFMDGNTKTSVRAKCTSRSPHLFLAWFHRGIAGDYPSFLRTQDREHQSIQYKLENSFMRLKSRRFMDLRLGPAQNQPDTSPSWWEVGTASSCEIGIVENWNVNLLNIRKSMCLNSLANASSS